MDSTRHLSLSSNFYQRNVQPIWDGMLSGFISMQMYLHFPCNAKNMLIFSR